MEAKSSPYLINALGFFTEFRRMMLKLYIFKERLFDLVKKKSV